MDLEVIARIIEEAQTDIGWSHGPLSDIQSLLRYNWRVRIKHLQDNAGVD